MKTVRLWLYSIVARFLPETHFFGLKRALLRWAGVKVGSNVRINSSACFLGNGELEIGDDVWIGADDLIYAVAPAKVVIGSCVDLAPRVMILTGTHEITPENAHVAGPGRAKSVLIGDGCWICAGATLLPGSELGEKSVVAARSVVLEGRFDAKSLVAGVPAEKKKNL